MKKGKNWGFSTNSVHAGEIRYNEYGAITTPIVQTSTFIFKNIEEIKKYSRKSLTGDLVNIFNTILQVTD